MRRLAMALGLAIATVIFPSQFALAFPDIENAREVYFDDSAPEEGSVKFFADVDEKGVFWWAPYKLELAKNPVTRRPILQWTATPEKPRISLTARLARFQPITESRLISSLRRQIGDPVAVVEVRPIALVDLSLALNFSSERGLPPGDWKPMTTLTATAIPETFPLTSEENDFLLAAARHGAAGLRLAVAFRGRFLGHLQARHFSVSYDSQCMLGILKGRSPEDGFPGMSLSRRFVAMALSRAAACVSSRTSRGMLPDSLEELSAWLDHLENVGLLIAADSGKESFLVATREAIDEYVSQGTRDFEKSVGAGRQLFPVEFGRLLTELAPDPLSP